MIKKSIGALMLLSVFVAIFLAFSVTEGLLITAIIFGLAIVGTFLIVVGLMLLFS